MNKRRRNTIILMALSIIIFAVLCIINAPRAESVLLLLVFMGMMFPALPVVALTELIQLIRADDKNEKAGFVIAVIAACLMCSYWTFMVLVGGDKNMPMALGVISINVIAVVLLRIKMKISAD